MIYKATIDVFLDVESDAHACDGMAETMRDHLRRYAPESCIVDWGYNPNAPHPVPATEAEIAALEPIDDIEGVSAFLMTPTGMQSVTLAQAFDLLVTPVEPAPPEVKAIVDEAEADATGPLTEQDKQNATLTEMQANLAKVDPARAVAALTTIITRMKEIDATAKIDDSFAYHLLWDAILDETNAALETPAQDPEACDRCETESYKVRMSGDIVPNSRAAWTVAIENLIRQHLTDPVIGVVRPDTKTINLSVGQDSGEPRRFVVRVSELRS